MRLRALPLLLVLTGGDYALWDWSIAGGHDVLSLISGLTLLPLAAATLALLALGAARLCSGMLEGARDRRRGSVSSRGERRQRGGARGRSRRHGQPRTPPHPAPAERASERTSRRLAA